MANYKDVNALIDSLIEIRESDCRKTKAFLLVKLAHLYKVSDRARPIVNRRLAPYTEYCDELKNILHPFKFPYCPTVNTPIPDEVKAFLADCDPNDYMSRHESEKMDSDKFKISDKVIVRNHKLKGIVGYVKSIVEGETITYHISPTLNSEHYFVFSQKHLEKYETTP